jgi:hypothetical protein
VKIPAKLAAAALVLLAVGVPVLETWEALFLAASWLAIVFGTCRAGRWRSVAALTVVVAVVGLKVLLPRANIAEAHNAFLVIGEGEALERGLPVQIFRSWKAHLDAFYPEPARAEGQAPVSYQWRQPEHAPSALFTASSDAIWRRPIFTRQVDAIEFRSLGEVRGGFANESSYKAPYTNLYNFWNGDLQRQSMPFYVMYRLTRASVGSGLAWKGQLFWERADGTFDEIVHANGVASRTIEPQDAGKRVYAAFFPARTPDMYFALAPSLTLRLAGWAEAFLGLAGGLAVLMLMVRPQWSGYLTALVLFSAGYLKMARFSQIGVEYLGRTYPPNWGGDDGMAFDGWGRAMAMLARRGEIVEAFKGAEPVYWFTPGMRYVRMVEKLIFGDTNHLHALILACLPIVIFYLTRHLIGSRWALWAWLMAATFCVMPVGNLSFLQYIAYANAGYAEAAAAGLFFLGLTLMLRTQPAWGGAPRAPAVVWMAGAALAASVFVRPNLVLAVAWLGVAYLWASWRRRDWGVMLAVSLGLVVALWMPFHNWFYGGELYLISRSGATISVPLGVGDYVSALGDMARGIESQARTATGAQLRGWLGGPAYSAYRGAIPWAATAHTVNLLALAIVCWLALRWVSGGLREQPALGVVAVAAICAHIPMLFIFSTSPRYAVIGWDLSLILLFASLVRWQMLVRDVAGIPRQIDVVPHLMRR